ncbi:MAG: response regulator [[Clostridium] symbiosum]
MTYQFLIVDDEYFVRQRIRLCIPWKEYGFECAGEAANVDQALRFLEATPVDLVILDISMPGANGLELLRMMKEQNSQIKFIILSGFATFEYARQAIACNVTNYLLKPIDTDELIRSITEIRETLDKNNHLKQERLAWQEARLIAEHAEKSTFFQNIFSGHASVSESAQLREFGVLQDVPCTVIVSDGRPKVIHSLSCQERAAFQTALGNLSGCLLSGKSGCIQVTDAYSHQVLILPHGAAARRTGSFSGTLILRCPGEFFQRHRVRLRIW